MSPWLSIVLPTAGRRAELFRTLESIHRQRRSGVETLVVLDTHIPGERARIDKLRDDVENLRMGVRWYEYDGGLNCYGQPQRTCGSRLAQGEWVAFSQDDNILADGAVDAIWMALCTEPHPRPLFFRVLTPWRQLVWSSPELVLSNIDADCLVLPRRVAQTVTWGLRYEGDFDAAVQAMQLADGDVGWREETIAIARPEQEHVWWS